MSKYNEHISDFYQKQKLYSYLKEINVKRNLDGEVCSDYELIITLCEYPFYEGNKRLKLYYFGVVDLKVGNLDTIFRLDIGINDISNRQMEGVKYQVIENENLLFSFYCREFKFELLE
ncbi:hypothetical protein [Paenibacillus eucommiae]|uniref:Uncharacterized protein n=1 Tax=Paenibacillus eucommiae TaxID=1355755 RepID=A0ABS4IME3_9BACL|nr:hypothetical protein [Paenibacillus eucommiae]MBP1988685.1 hypothetical protein [Paenibacillus eucommiae]